MTENPESPESGEHEQKSRRWAIPATVIVVALIVGGIWWSSRSGDDDTPASQPSSSPSPTQTVGEPSDEPSADETSEAPEPADVEILIDTPEEGAEVGTTFTVTGKAAAFEATVEWELSKDGTVAQEGFTTAEECCTLSPFSFEVTAETGDYTLTVRNTDPSEGEGNPPAEASREITVR